MSVSAARKHGAIRIWPLQSVMSNWGGETRARVRPSLINQATRVHVCVYNKETRAARNQCVVMVKDFIDSCNDKCCSRVHEPLVYGYMYGWTGECLVCIARCICRLDCSLMSPVTQHLDAYPLGCAIWYKDSSSKRKKQTTMTLMAGPSFGTLVQFIG